MKLMTSLLSLLLLFPLALCQDPALRAQQSCTQFKSTVFEERVAVSFFFPNAPVTWETVNNCHGSRPLIVGGKPAEPKEFGPAARLGNRDSINSPIKWFCGGTLISQRLVLTAAHCLFTPDGAVNVVRLGDLDFDSTDEDADPEDFGVRKTTEHPAYKHPNLYNDIAIVELDRAVNLSVYKHPACLPFNNGDNEPNFIAIGWGFRGAAVGDSSKLLKVQLNDFKDRCNAFARDIDELSKGFNATTQLCVGSTMAKDTCNGDSGGPLLTYHAWDACMYHVVGITSVGIGCGTPNIPSFYTRVYFYLDWIQQQMAKTQN